MTKSEASEYNSNDIRFSDTVQPEPIRGTGDYEFAKRTELNDKEFTGAVGKVTFDSGYGIEGYETIPTNSNVDTRNSDTNLNVDYDRENLSKKYKYPQKSQSTVSEDETARPNRSI